jgi:hypothetical protein
MKWSRSQFRIQGYINSGPQVVVGYVLPNFFGLRKSGGIWNCYHLLTGARMNPVSYDLQTLKVAKTYAESMKPILDWDKHEDAETLQALVMSKEAAIVAVMNSHKPR